MSQNLQPVPAEVEKPVYASSSVADEKLETVMLSQLMDDDKAPMQVLHLLSEDCFSTPAHRAIFKAIVALDRAGLPINRTSVLDQMYKDVSKDRANLLVAEAANVFGNTDSMSLEYMALRLKEYAKRRLLGEVSSLILRLNTDMSYPFEKGVNKIQELFDRIVMGDGTGESFVTLTENLEKLKTVIEDNQHDQTRHSGLFCGLPQIDQQGGLPADGVVVIGAKSSHGKTTLATNVAISALKRGMQIVFYSMEMSKEKVTGRIVAMESGISSNALQRQRLSLVERQKALHCIDALRTSVGHRFFFDNRSVRDLDSLVMSIRSLKKSRGIDCVVVDYLQLMNDSPGQHSENATKLLGGIAHRLHEVAQDLHVTILLLSQINRTVQGEPTMSHLRDSGEIAEAADMVIIAYNADFEHVTLPRPFDTIPAAGKLLIKVEKNRDGATQSFLVGFDPVATRVFPLVDEEECIEPSLFPNQ